MNLLSSILAYTARQIAALRSADTATNGRIDTTNAAASALTNRVSTAEADIVTINGRLDTAISGVTTDTEVTDIRQGDDGVTYQTAGTAVRTQFSQLKSKLSDVVTFSNTDTKEKFTVYSIGKLYDVGNAVKYKDTLSTIIEINSTTDAYAVIIPLVGVKSISYPVFKTSSGYGSFIFDADNVLIWKHAETSINTGGLYTMNIPDGASYMLLSISASLAPMTWTGTIHTDSLDEVRENIKQQNKINALIDDVLIGNIKIYSDGINYEALNGATVDADTATITIPSGATGKNAYVQKSFKLPSYMAGKSFKVIVKVDSPDQVIPTTGDWITVLRPNGLHIETYCSLVDFTDGVYTFELGATANSPVSSYYGVTLQVKKDYTISSAVEIRLMDAYVLSEDYTSRVLNNNPPTVLRVGTGKEYTSLRSALEACKNGNAQNRYIVEWYSGGDVYDANNDITSADLDNVNFVGLTVPPYTKLVGMNRYSENVITLTLDSSLSATVRNRISTLNLQENGEIENLTVIGSNCRYAIHDDTNSYNPVWEEKHIKNCRVVSNGTRQTRAYGAGYRSGQKWVFENCIFELTGAELQTGYAAFTAHNNNGFTKPSTLEFYNCRFVGGGSGAGFGSLNAGDSDVINTIKMVGCKAEARLLDAWEWKSPIIMYDESGSNTGCEISITGYANNFGADGIKFRTNDSVDYSDRVTVWGKITE